MNRWARKRSSVWVTGVMCVYPFQHSQNPNPMRSKLEQSSHQNPTSWRAHLSSHPTVGEQLFLTTPSFPSASPWEKSSIFKVCSPSQGKGKDKKLHQTSCTAWADAEALRMERTPQPPLEMKQPSKTRVASTVQLSQHAAGSLGQAGSLKKLREEVRQETGFQDSERACHQRWGERIRIIPSSVVKANDAARQESRGSHSRSWF